MKNLPVQKNQVLDISIDALTQEGAGVGRLEGYVLLVMGALPGERVQIQVIRVSSAYGVGKLLKVLEPSKDRVEPICPCYDACGGCSLQHLSYEAQLVWKRQSVLDALTRIGGLKDVEVAPVIGMDKPCFYRNKAAFPYGMTAHGSAFGFYAPRSHRLTPVTRCLIQKEEVNAVMEKIDAWARCYAVAPYEEETGKGCLRHAVVRVTASGQRMAVIVTTGALPHKKELLEALRGVESIYHNINAKNTNVIFGDRFNLLQGEAVLLEHICGLNFRVSPASFLQVNPVQTRKLYEKALELLNPQREETVADLYCGMGSISLLLAKRCKKVIGIEYVPAAVEDAKENARLNGLDNTEFICAPAEKALPTLMEQGLEVDAITLDPPRKGCEEAVLKAIVASSVKRLVYVSCNPATLARDLAVLTAGGFQVKTVRPVDMFPLSGHVETVCLLSRNK